jgi:uncharacterized protein (TIGR01777 family)
MHVLVTGATGLVGPRVVSALLARGDTVTVLSRNPDSARARLGDVRAIGWSPPTVAAEALHGVDGVVHLAGEPVPGRWTEDKKRRIHDSREHGTKALVDAIAAAESRPSVLVSASAIGWYGDRGDEVLVEASGPGDDFLAGVCKAWEEAAAGVEAHGVRRVSLRIGLVLDPDGGALGEMLPMAKLGLAGPLGGGRQWWSWIHRDDLVAMLLAALDGDWSGAYNATAPNPVTQGAFAKAVGAVLGRPAFLPAPAFALRIALGGFSAEILTSKKILPQRAQEAGFAFRFSDLDPALKDLL